MDKVKFNPLVTIFLNNDCEEFLNNSYCESRSEYTETEKSQCEIESL